MHWLTDPVHAAVLQVLLVSAEEAFLSRLMLRQDPGPPDGVVQRFKERAFGSSRAGQRGGNTAAKLQAAADEMLADSGEGARRHLGMCTFARHHFNPQTALMNAVAPVASAGAGIQELEDSVVGFLYSHAGIVKLMAVVDDMTRMLSQVAACLPATPALVYAIASRMRLLPCSGECEPVRSRTIRAVTLQMANSMAVSEGALVQDVTVMQVTHFLSGRAGLVGHHLVEAASCPWSFSGHC